MRHTLNYPTPLSDLDFDFVILKQSCSHRDDCTPHSYSQRYCGLGHFELIKDAIACTFEEIKLSQRWLHHPVLHVISPCTYQNIVTTITMTILL